MNIIPFVMNEPNLPRLTTCMLKQSLQENIAEAIGLDELNKSNPHIYWGTAPTRMPSIAYLLPLLKLKQCINLGLKVTIFIADMHSFMDKGAEHIKRTEDRAKFYEYLLVALMRLLNVERNQYSIVFGSQVQLTPQYMKNLLHFTTMVNVNEAKHAAADVVKKNEQPKLSSLIYPLMQCLDEVALNADIQLGGTDQRKIFMLGRDFMDKLGFKKCVYLMNPLIPSLIKGEKMSSSADGKIDFLDNEETIQQKIKKAFCVPGEIGPCTELLKYICFPMRNTILINNTNYDYASFEKAWLTGQISPQDLKASLAAELSAIISPIRTLLQTEGLELFRKAYD